MSKDQPLPIFDELQAAEFKVNAFLQNLRTLLILGRISNLPTVWSNLIVGWTLANGPSIGPGHPPDTTGPLLLVLLGGSFLYVGGMYLNDFCDAAFDVRYCQTRPIPAGKISRRLVGFLAILWFIAGLACFTSSGPVTLGFALLLIIAIIVYDINHKNVVFAPLVMGLCRSLLYLLAFSAFRESFYFSTVDGDWWDDALNYVRNDYCSMAWDVILFSPMAIPLGLYVAGITYLARGESRPGKPARWALLLLLLPVVSAIALTFTLPSYHHFIQLLPLTAACISQLAWMAWLLLPLWRKTNPSIGRVVSGLLAGIVLVDIIVVTPFVGLHGFVLLPLFALALLLQRVVPAT